MIDDDKAAVHQRWAHLRFSVIGPLLAAPPEAGELRAELLRLAEKMWVHPVTGEPVRFAVSTVERWFYQAKKARIDPVGALRKKVRKDLGQQPALRDELKPVLLTQYRTHRSWSCQLHYDNLKARATSDPALRPIPSYSTVRRFMKSQGLTKRRRLPDTPGGRRAVARLDEREVRSFEVEYVNGLWHLDFHHGSKKVLSPDGRWLNPLVLGVLDDRSRLACHVQWYLAETAENLVHGLSQAIQKRGLPRSLMTDNGSAMIAAETTQGLLRLGIVHQTTLPHSPYQNAKQEVFWGQLEGRLVAMLEGVGDLTLALLNQATQAWAEMEYNKKVHTETGQAPIDRFLAGPDAGRAGPDSKTLRLAFAAEENRAHRRSDGTIALAGRRFEIPARYRTLERVTVRFATWDLSLVHMIDPRTGSVLCRLFPLDKVKNADGQRRTLPSGPLNPELPLPVEAGIAPLLSQLMADYAATGLPPAYLPKDEIETADPDAQPEELS